MILEYIFLYKFFIFCLLVVLLLFSVSFFLIYQVIEIEKSSAYECGFNPFTDSRVKFEIRFYLVGILFLIFDLELIFILPWLLVLLEELTLLANISMLFFFFIIYRSFLWNNKRSFGLRIIKCV